MMLTTDLAEELNFLMRYRLDTTLEGIKVHKDAPPEVVAAARRLFDKSLVTREDGGYLTELGRECAEHAHAALMLLEPLRGDD